MMKDKYDSNVVKELLDNIDYERIEVGKKTSGCCMEP